jgi:hypothetical protein
MRIKTHFYTSQLLLAVMLWLPSAGVAQNGFRIGDWQSFLPANLGSSVAQSDTKIFYASEGQLLILDKEDGSVEKWSKVEGLSDVSLAHVRYHEPTGSLVIAYDNSNIDVIKDGQILNFSAIRDNLSITGDKRIYNVSFGDRNNVFFSCGFGMVEFYLDRQVFGTTLITPVRVTDVVSWNGFLYLGTQEGLYRIQPDSVLLLSDFGLWEPIDDPLLSGAVIEDVCAFGNMLYAGAGNQIYSSVNGIDFTLFYQAGNQQQLRYISGEASRLIAGFACNGGNCTPAGYRFEANGQVTTLPASCFASPAYALEDAQGRIWFADRFRGFRNLGPSDGACSPGEYNAPYSSNVSEIDVKNGRLYIASGGTQPNGDYLFREDGFFILDQGTWKNYNKFSVPAFNALDLRDFFRIRAHPKKDILYVGNYLAGLLEWKGPDDFTLFDPSNSSLGGTVGDIQRTRVSGMEFDRNDNLWISNFLALNPISVYTKDGQWKSFSVPGSTELQQVVVDDAGNKWFGVYRNGLLVFNEGRDMNKPAEYKYRQINTVNSLLPSNNVNCLAKDLDGAIWVGTDQGILVFECGSDPFRDQCRGTDRRLEQDGYGAILLSTETIRAISVDGANRKWIGTSNGLFVQSANGEEAVFNYTTNNSPLLDNNIVAIKADLETGLVYIGTNRGVQAIRSDATGALAVFEEDLIAFPNPVRPEYDGPIAIKGLARDANFKITDADGRLVFEGRANGGQAMWNGRDLSGRRVDSGVYLIFATHTRNLEFPSAKTGKIVVIR